MARSFNGTTQFLSYAGALAAAVPLTLAGWFLTSAAQAQSILGIGNTGTAFDFFELGVNSTRNVSATARSSSPNTTASATTAVAATSGAWTHGAAVFTSATSRAAYIGGANKVTNATSVTPAGLNQTDIGAVEGTSRSHFMSGRIAEVGLWSVALSDAEIAALATGVRPYRVRPGSLVGYWPLWGLASPEPDLSPAGHAMTVTGATAANHAPVTPFTGKWRTPPDIAAAAAFARPPRVLVYAGDDYSEDF